MRQRDKATLAHRLIIPGGTRTRTHTRDSLRPSGNRYGLCRLAFTTIYQFNPAALSIADNARSFTDAFANFATGTTPGFGNYPAT